MLNHVCVWKDGKWKRITEEEADKMFPYRISSDSGLFMCELCGQFVSFTKGDTRKRYFKHSRGETNKECEDRSIGYYNPESIQKKDLELPIRIIQYQDDYSFQIGLPEIPENILEKQQTNEVIIANEYEEKRIYSFERLAFRGTTYVDVGKRLASRYELKLGQDTEDIWEFWPKTTITNGREGRLFDVKTGKMLPFDTDVEVGKLYYYFTKEFLLPRVSPSLKRVSKLDNGNLYMVSATNLDEENAKFFLSIRARLTNTPLMTLNIWPPSANQDGVVRHTSHAVWMYLSGNARVTVDDRLVSPIGEEKDNWSLYRIPIRYNRQFALIGRTGVLDYCRLQRDEKKYEVEDAKVEITDINKNPLEGYKQQKLPPEKKIFIQAEYDGIAIIQGKERYFKKKITSDRVTPIENIDFGTSITVTVGCDVVRQIYFEPKKKNRNNEVNWSDFLHRIREAKGRDVKVDSTEFATYCSSIADERVRAFIRNAASRGTLPSEAVSLLRKETMKFRRK